ncbi:hypothetical protein LAZ67_1006079 [Cordylochernes scorpioides]|uniref:Ig-like domain-containing protein n=1 Tax=Cordylochernes scorpioides TaxID=51811 RepID=A0ABY6JYF4_9ARAC|nr:hypothetical protein LAZ67_1006079 [Cordylochernes scorpioides]
MLEDRRVTAWKLCDLVPDVSKTTIDKILREHSGYSKVCAIWVPKMLTEDHKQPPRVEGHFGQEQPRKGDKAELECRSSGDLPITFTWKKNGIPIDPSTQPRYRVGSHDTSEGSVSTLTIHNAERADSGLITCRVTNKYGKDEASHQLIVLELRTDPEWKDKIITGYETWVYGYDPETKHQSAEWRCQGHRKRRQFKQTDAFTRGMVIGLKRAGWSMRQIAADTHLGAPTVHRLWRRWLEQGNVAIYRNVGATRVTSARVDRRILRQAVAAPQATCTAILQHVQDTLDHSISTRTISRRLVANGLHSCRPLRRLPLTPPNRRQRLEWCRARSTWMTEWHRVVFSDESRFCLSSDSRRVRVWRQRGERSNPAAIVERPTVRQCGIMVWGAIAYDSRSPLLRIQGTMTAQRYVDDVLPPVTLPYLQGREWRAIPQDAIRTLIDSLPRRVAACIAVRGGPTCY